MTLLLHVVEVLTMVGLVGAAALIGVHTWREPGEALCRVRFRTAVDGDGCTLVACSQCGATLIVGPACEADVWARVEQWGHECLGAHP